MSKWQSRFQMKLVQLQGKSVFIAEATIQKQKNE